MRRLRLKQNHNLRADALMFTGLNWEQCATFCGSGKWACSRQHKGFTRYAVGAIRKGSNVINAIANIPDKVRFFIATGSVKHEHMDENGFIELRDVPEEIKEGMYILRFGGSLNIMDPADLNAPESDWEDIGMADESRALERAGFKTGKDAE